MGLECGAICGCGCVGLLAQIPPGLVMVFAIWFGRIPVSRVTINFGPAPNYQNLLVWGLTLPHYFLGEFVLAILLLAAATLYRRLLPSTSLLWLDGISLLLIALALADLRLSEIMGVRLDWQAVETAAI